MALQLREQNRITHILAYRDSMTGLRNTTSYKSWAEDLDKSINERNIEFGLAILDINYLKQTNDQYGHDVGNKLIVSAARIISDTFKRSPVFRIGGDEFLVILQNRDLEEYKQLLKNLEETCTTENVSVESDIIPISIAHGTAIYKKGEDTCFADVFNRADDAMYQNKKDMKRSLQFNGKKTEEIC